MTPYSKIQALLTALLLMLSSASAIGQDETSPSDTQPPQDEQSEGTTNVLPTGVSVNRPVGKSGDFLLAPAIFYTQESNLGFLVFSLFTFYPQKRLDNWPSTLLASASYSLNHQVVITVEPDFYFSNNGWRLAGSYQYRLYPDQFYGLGMGTPDIYQNYTKSEGAFRTEGQVAILGEFLVGLVWDIGIYSLKDQGSVYDGDTDTVIDDAPPLFDPDTVPGMDGGLTNGFGVSLLYDYRDDVQLTTTGGYYYSSLVTYQSFLGSDYDFTSWTVDLRQFFTIVPSLQHVLGFQIFNESQWGDAPFYKQSFFGGSDRMRGWRQGRFIDTHMFEAQLEYRLPIWNRLGAVAFAGVGEVYNSGGFDFSALTWSAGGGLRLIYGESTVLRADFGGGPGVFGVIFGADQAF